MKQLLPLILLLLPVAASAANREMVELQRDVAALQDQVRTLQRTLDEKLAQLQTIVQQTLDTSSKSNTSVAVLDNAMRERLGEQQKTMAGPVANMNAKMDQMSADFNGMRESVADMSDRMNKLNLQITELGNTVRTMSAPAAPPPAAVPTASAVPPTQLYESAMRDRSGGNLDLAAQGFNEYLRAYPATELAPNAQFYLGQIAYDKGDFPGAIRNFDTVLEKYTDNPKTPDAIFMKGMSLLKAGQRDAAAKEFLNVSTKFPNSEVANKAKLQRRALGLATPTATVVAPRKRR